VLSNVPAEFKTETLLFPEFVTHALFEASMAMLLGFVPTENVDVDGVVVLCPQPVNAAIIKKHKDTVSAILDPLSFFIMSSVAFES